MLILALTLLRCHYALSLSFSGAEDSKSNMLFADDPFQDNNPKFMNVKQTTEHHHHPPADTSVSQSEESRKMRLYILGALMEQLIAWLFQDILPKDVLRHKRAANGQGKSAYII